MFDCSFNTNIRCCTGVIKACGGTVTNAGETCAAQHLIHQLIASGDNTTIDGNITNLALNTLGVTFTCINV